MGVGGIHMAGKVPCLIPRPALLHAWNEIIALLGYMCMYGQAILCTESYSCELFSLLSLLHAGGMDCSSLKNPHQARGGLVTMADPSTHRSQSTPPELHCWGLPQVWVP